MVLHRRQLGCRCRCAAKAVTESDRRPREAPGRPGTRIAHQAGARGLLCVFKFFSLDIDICGSHTIALPPADIPEAGRHGVGRSRLGSPSHQRGAQRQDRFRLLGSQETASVRLGPQRNLQRPCGSLRSPGRLYGGHGNSHRPTCLYAGGLIWSTLKCDDWHFGQEESNWLLDVHPELCRDEK